MTISRRNFFKGLVGAIVTAKLLPAPAFAEDKFSAKIKDAAQIGLFEYVVVCDETNNTPAVIDRNEFVADIYLKETRTPTYKIYSVSTSRQKISMDEIRGTLEIL